MRTYENFTSGLRSYRTPNEIRSDMKEIISHLEVIQEKLNIRDLVVEALYKNEEMRPAELIEELHILLEDADGALVEMENLKATLSMLGEELLDTRAVVL